MHTGPDLFHVAFTLCDLQDWLGIKHPVANWPLWEVAFSPTNLCGWLGISNQWQSDLFRWPSHTMTFMVDRAWNDHEQTDLFEVVFPLYGGLWITHPVANWPFQGDLPTQWPSWLTGHETTSSKTDLFEVVLPALQFLPGFLLLCVQGFLHTHFIGFLCQLWKYGAPPISQLSPNLKTIFPTKLHTQFKHLRV